MKIRALLVSSIFICCFLMSAHVQVQAQSYVQQVAKGEELVQAFGRLVEQNAGIDALEEMAVRISQNYQARLLLKNKYQNLGRVYHNMWLRGQGSLAQRMIAKARKQLRDLGYLGRAVDDLQVISNVASAREMRAPMDLDIGVSTMGREQTRQFIRELRNQGKSPQIFLQDLQQALDQAYREVANEAQVLAVDPGRAFVTGTAAWHPEAYADLDVLNELPPGRTLVEQTVDVSKRKVNEMRILVSENVLTMDEAILEAGRGTLKDVRKLRAGFAEIERVYGLTPELKGTNAWVVDQLEKLARGDLLPQQAAAKFHSRGLNFFDACNQVMDQLEAAWKLAPVSKTQGLIMALFRKYLPQDRYLDFVQALKGEGIESVSGKAGRMARQVQNMIGANFISLQGADAGKFIAQFKAQYTDVIFEVGDKKLAELLDYVRSSSKLNELAEVVGDRAAVKLARIKAMVPDLTFPKSASRFIANNIPLPSVDKRTNELILGDINDSLNMEAVAGVALCLYEMNGIVDQGLSREQENQQLAEAFARNLPIVGDFFQGVVDGHAGYLEGNRQKMAQSAAYLFIGAAGLVPGGQVPAMVAGLGMASIQLGSSAWHVGAEKELIQAVLDCGEFDPDTGRLQKVRTQERETDPPEFSSLVVDGELHFQTGLPGRTIRDAIYAWGERYFLPGAQEFELLKRGFDSLYPDFDLDRNLREKMNTGRSLLATRILEQGGNPRRDAAMAMFVQMKRVFDQAGQAALAQIVDVAEQEYQARHHTGQALEISRELRALGQRLGLPLVENTDRIFNSFSSFAQKALTSPWVRESMRLQKVNLQKRYLEGYLQIEAHIEDITQRLRQVRVNVPRSWNLTGYLEIDRPRIQDLKNAYLSQGLGRARKDAMAIRKKAGQEGRLDLSDPCDAQVFHKLAKIRISLVHRQDLKLLMAQWQGKELIAAQSRDQALAQAEQEITDQSLVWGAMQKLAKAHEQAYAWASASLPWSGGYEVYEQAVETVESQIAKLSAEYVQALEQGPADYKVCRGEVPSLQLVVTGPAQLESGEQGTLQAVITGGTKGTRELSYRWSFGSRILPSQTAVQPIAANKAQEYTVKVEVRGLVNNQHKVLGSATHNVLVVAEEDHLAAGKGAEDTAEEGDSEDTSSPKAGREAQKESRADGDMMSEATEKQTGKANKTSLDDPGFAATLPGIWTCKYIEHDPRLRFKLERAAAGMHNKDTKNCPHKASVGADLWGIMNPSFHPQTKEEIRSELEEEIEGNGWEDIARLRPLSIQDFLGWFYDIEVDYSKGWANPMLGYHPSGVAVHGHGYVLKGRECIEVKYRIGGRGCYTNSDRAFLESQAQAARGEAQAIIASLKLIENGKFTKIPYTGPKLDGSDLLQVAIQPSRQGPYRSGQVVELQAEVSGGKAPYTYVWEGNLGTSGQPGTTASFTASKPDTYPVTVTVQDSAGSQAEADLNLVVEALQAEMKGVLPDVVYGQTAVLSVDIKGGLPGGGAGPQSDQVGENQAYVPNPDEEDEGPGLVYIWQARPELAFAQGTTSVPTTTVTYDRMGTVKIWAQVLSQKGKVRTTIGETPQVTAQVQAPKFAISFDPAQGRVGQDVRARVMSEPVVAGDLIDYRWFSPRSSNRMEYADNSGVIGFTVPESGNMDLRVLARVPVHGDEISEITAGYSGRGYQVQVTVQRQGPPPMTWDPKTGGLVKIPQGSQATGARIFLQAKLVGQPQPEAVRWQWTVNEGTFISNEISSTPTVSRSEPGTISAEVQARSAEDQLLGTGSISLPVVSVQAGPGTGEEPVSNSSGKIFVQSATYGGNCGVDPGNVTDHIEEACNGKSECTYTVDHKLIGDPAYGCKKTYVVTYRCGTDKRTYDKRLSAEAGWGNKAVVLRCPPAAQDRQTQKGGGNQTAAGDMSGWKAADSGFEVTSKQISASPAADNETSYFIAPDALLGDWSNVSHILVEKKSSGGRYYTGSHGDIGDIVLLGPNGSASYRLAKDHSGEWKAYRVPLDGPGWTFADGAKNMADLVANVIAFRIRAEYGYGPDTSAIRGVRLVGN